MQKRLNSNSTYTYNQIIKTLLLLKKMLKELFTMKSIHSFCEINQVSETLTYGNCYSKVLVGRAA